MIIKCILYSGCFMNGCILAFAQAQPGCCIGAMYFLYIIDAPKALQTLQSSKV